MKIFTKRRVAIGMVAAAVASVAFFALGGPAKAADLIDGSDVKDQSLFSPDLGPDSVGQSEVKPKAVHSTELSDGVWLYVQNGQKAWKALPGKASTTQAKQWADAAETNAKNHANVVADSAENAAKGYADANDAVGINESRAGAGYTTVAKPGYSVAYNKCDTDGQVAISGGFRLNGHASEAFSGADQNAMPEGLTVVASEPAAEKGGTLVNSYQDPTFPQTEDGAFQANAWAVTFKNDTDHDLPVRVWATCVSVD